MMKLFSLSLCSLLVCSAHGATKEIGTLTKSFDKKYAVENTDFYVEIENKYGDVQVIPWEKDSIRVQAQVEVRSERDDRLAEMLGNIQVDFEKTQTFLLVTAGWADDASFFKRTSYSLKKGLNSEDRVVITQTIYLPADMALEINNRFGNVFMSDHKGELTIGVSHGDFRARRLDNVDRIEVKYGRLRVKKLQNARVELGSVSSAKIDEAGKLTLNSSSSDVEIEYVKDLVLTSKHDDIHIESGEEIQGTTSLSDISIDLVEKELDVTAKLGSIHIDETASNTRQVRLQGSKTDITIGISETFVGNFKLDVDSKCYLTYSGKINVESKGVDTEGRQFLNGSLGTEAATRIIVKAEGGSVDVNDR